MPEIAENSHLSFPAVSIVMALYNQERYVAEAVRSVQNQTFQDFELIVVNDGSTDSSTKIISQFERTDPRIEVIHQTNSGRPGVARNRGLKNARGEFVAFLDPDDYYSPQRLETCVNIMRQRPDIGLLFHDLNLADATGILKERSYLRCPLSFDNFIPPVSEQIGDTYILDTSFFLLMSIRSAAMHTASIFIRKTGKINRELQFAEDVVIAEDLDLWLRLVQMTRTAYLDRRLATYRQHGHSLTNRHETFFRDAVKVHERNFARHCREFDRNSARAYRKKIGQHYKSLAYLLLREGKNSEARKAYLKGFKQYFELSFFPTIIKTFLPWNNIRQLCSRISSAR